ncbi:carbonic anhydrase2, partial [Biomphalaria glabrata]
IFPLHMTFPLQRLVKMAVSPRSTYSLTVAIFISAGISTVEADATTWNYEKGTYGGPDNWFIKYPDCGGKMQSPINIPAGALYNPNLRYFNFSDYARTVGVNLTLTNKGGHTVEVEYSGTPIILRGGSLPDEYKLVQYHFHWGAQDSRGSEHLLDGKHFPMELHLVHHQAHLADVKVAMSHPFGLAVLGFFFQVSPYNNTKLDTLLEHFDLIRTVAPQQDNETEIELFPLMDILPDNIDKLDYYRYFGSLTTPPCYETVIWSIATEHIPISEYQLNIFRSLYNDRHLPLVNDYRPIQALNDRTVITTKRPTTTTATTTTPKATTNSLKDESDTTQIDDNVIHRFRE